MRPKIRCDGECEKFCKIFCKLNWTQACHEWAAELTAALVSTARIKALAREIQKKCYSTYHIECLRPVHGALNVDKKKLIA